MTRLLGISGSLRAGSFNTALLHAASELVGEGVELEVATLHGIPLYDGDAETRDGIPDAVQALKAKVKACDGLLLATPEYNNAMPGVFKNGIDWLSRPAKDIPDVFGGRAVALLGASPGGFGTVLGQNAWLPVLRTLGAELWTGGKLLVSRAGNVFDDNGAMVDDRMRGQLRDYLAGFVTFVRERHAG